MVTQYIIFNCQKPKSSPKTKSKIQVQNPKSKVQRKWTGTGADTIFKLKQATTTPPTTHQ